MASIIRIKKSEVSGNPSTLASGEMAYSALDNPTSGNRLYIGTGTETGGDAANHEVIGGKYFTEMLDHTKGVVTAQSALIVDSASKLNELNVDNIVINGNTISTTSGDLVLGPSGTVDFSGNIISNVGTPTSDSDVATKGYVDNQVGGVTFDFSGNTGTDTFSSASGTLVFTGTGGINTSATDDVLTIDFTNDSFTLGSSTITLGGTTTDIAGLTSLSVDNININGNTITSTDTDGNITISPDGEGTIVVDAGYASRSNFGSNTLVPKSYVDGVASSLDIKASVRVATTTNISLTTDLQNGDTIDGVTLATNDRVLVKDQSDASENGIYTVVASGTASRSTDADTASELSGGTFTFVEEGSTNADTGFVFTHNGTPTLETTNLTVTQFSGAGNIDAGAGLVKSGSNLSVLVDSASLSIVSDEVTIATGGVTNSHLANSSITVNGNATSLGGSVTLDTDDIGEGTNLYFTDERVDDRVNGLLVAGTGLGTFSYNDGANTLTLNASAATVNALGVSSYDSDQFTVTSGAVTITEIDGGTY